MLGTENNISKTELSLDRFGSNRTDIESSVLEISKIVANGDCTNTISSLSHLIDMSGASLSVLIRHSQQELINTFNFSPSIAQRLYQIFKFYSAIRRNENTKPSKITTSKDAYTYMHSRLFGSSVERVYALYLNQANHIIGCQMISLGGINQAPIDIRVLIRGVLNCLGVGVIMVHNHPSGSLNPSRQDDLVTTKIKNALLLMDIKLLDHVIYTDSNHFSYADENRL